MIVTDLEPYREYVDCFDISEKQKLELINALWVLAENILDMQFGLNQIEITTLKQDVALVNQTAKMDGES
jgi:hypothetical protein